MQTKNLRVLIVTTRSRSSVLNTAYRKAKPRNDPPPITIPVEPRLVDGNHVIASHHERPWQRQLNILLAYTFFYNPLRFLWALVRPKCRRGHMQDAVLQMMGMVGLGTAMAAG